MREHTFSDSLKGSSQPLLWFCLHLGTRLTKLLKISTQFVWEAASNSCVGSHFQTPRPPNFQTWTECDQTFNKTRVEEWLEKAEEPTFKYPLMVFCTYSKEAYCLRRAGRFFMSFNRLSSAWRIWFENMKLWKSDRVCNLGLVTKESVSSYLSVMFPPSWAELRAMVSPSVHPASPRSSPVQPTLPSNPGAPHVQLGRVHH